jgi:hypothetical protein
MNDLIYIDNEEIKKLPGKGKINIEKLPSKPNDSQNLPTNAGTLRSVSS